jgi:hypothetical protein
LASALDPVAYPDGLAVAVLFAVSDADAFVGVVLQMRHAGRCMSCRSTKAGCAKVLDPRVAFTGAG